MAETVVIKDTQSSGKMLFLCAIAAIGGILFGYDTAVVSGTVNDVQKQFSLSDMALGWFVGCALIGSILGVCVAGWLSDLYGRKTTLILSSLMFTVSALGCMLSEDFTTLVIYRIIGGLGIGMVSIVSPMYISEVASTKWRGALVSLYQLAITIGFLCAYLTNFFIINRASSGYSSLVLQWLFSDEMWRGMLGAEMLPAWVFFILLFFIPESGRWLSLRRTRSDVMISTKDERWRELWRPGIRKAVFVGSAIALLGQFMGVNAVLYYGPTIFEDAGLSGNNAFMSQVLVGVVNTVTTVLALCIIDRVGRKQLVYYGVSGMIVALLFIGLYFRYATLWSLPQWTLLTAFLSYVFCCAISICAVVFVLLSEMYPTTVRGRAMSIAGLSLWIGTYLIGQLTPWMLNTLTPAGTFFLFSVMCVPYIYIVRFHVPETAGRTLEEIEHFWEK